MENNSFTFNSKNFWVGTLFFCAVFGIAFFAANDEIDSLMISMDPNGLVGRSIDKRNPQFYKNYDVLFLGDSRSNEGLDPNTFNATYLKLTGKKISAYNAARPGMQSPFFYFIIKDYLLQAKQPLKAIVVNGSFDALWGKAWIKELWLPYYNPKLWQLKEALTGLPIHYTAQWAFKSIIPLYRYRKRINDLSKILITDPKSFYREIERSEHVQNTRAQKKYLGYFPKLGYRVDEKEVDPFCIFNKGMEVRMYKKYMKKFFGLAKEYDFKIFVYGFPWLEKCKNVPTFYERRQYYFEKLKEVAKGNPNIYFIEYPDYWSPEYFANPLHLNHKGAQILTKKIVNHIYKHLDD